MSHPDETELSKLSILSSHQKFQNEASRKFLEKSKY